MADKIVTDNILEKATEGIIQLIADNIFEFESYNDTEIAELFSLTPEEAQHISDLIADTVISQYKLWSSKKVSDELISAKNECNDYTDTRLANISSISLKYCTALPSVGESNCIYILKSTDSNPDTLNLYDGTWISIGSFTIKLDDFYKKLEIDTKLDLKADKTEILAQDDVITDTSLATTTNVLSATTTIEELDKKVDKTSIVTSISSTSTDDTVPSAKAVYDNCIKDNNIKTYTTLEQLGLVTPTTISEIFNKLPSNSKGLFEVVKSKVTDMPTITGGYTLLLIEKLSNGRFNIMLKPSLSGSVAVNELYIGQLKGDDGTGLTWKRVCTTKVENTDVVVKSISNDEISSGTMQYKVINGICHLSLLNLRFSTTAIVLKMLPDDTVPRCAINECWGVISDVSGSTNNALIRVSQEGCLGHYILNDITKAYSGYFSYPVKES